MSILCGSAFAQSFGGAFEGMSNTNDPIQIEADSLEVTDEQGVAQFKGNVSVVQGTTILTASSLKVFYFNNDNSGSNPNSRIKRIVAGGANRVAVRSGEHRATANQLEVDMQTEKISLRGDVVVSQGDNVFTGCVLNVDLKTNNATLRPCKAATKVGSKERIKIILTPSSNKN